MAAKIQVRFLAGAIFSFFKLVWFWWVVAEWRSAGLITQRSEDQNLVLLYKKMLFFFFFITYVVIIVVGEGFVSFSFLTVCF